MRWLTYIVTVFLTLAIEKSLVNALTIESLGGIRPSAMGALVVFITLFASRPTALWAAWICGVLMDLSFIRQHAGGTVAYLIGPHALGYVFGCYLVLQLRAMVLRRRVLTVAVLTIAALLAAGVVTAAILTVRSWYPQAELVEGGASGTQQLFWHLGSAVYSGLLALPMGFLLLASLPLWSFPHVGPRGGTHR